MARSLRISAAFLFLLVGSAFAIASENPVPSEARLREWFPLERQHLAARLDKHKVTVGATIRITESLPGPLQYSLVEIRHRVQRLAFYHRLQDRMVYLDHSPHTEVATESQFTGLPTIVADNGGFELAPAPRTLEYRKVFSFCCRRPGIFLIQVEWTVEEDYALRPMHEFKSNQVLLVVRPTAESNTKSSCGTEPGARTIDEDQEELERLFSRSSNADSSRKKQPE